MLKFSSKIEEKNALFTFEGEMDKVGLSEVREDLKKEVEGLKDGVSAVFDFKKMTFINSEGIGFLVEMNDVLVAKSAALYVYGCNSHVSDVFNAVGIKEVVKVSKGFPNGVR
jgi:anti-anti-sigma factor